MEEKCQQDEAEAGGDGGKKKTEPRYPSICTFVLVKQVN
jgi:hypothetical protein